VSGVHKPYKVLVVSHTFPPAGGIGGRRWAKFAKSLMAKGCQVEIISAQMNDSALSLWSDDVRELTINRYATHFPEALAGSADSFWRRVKYKLAFYYSSFRSKGSPYDRATFDKRTFLTCFSGRMASFNPHVVIVTGPPFNLPWYLAGVRSRYPLARFFSDFRDPWMGGSRYGYGLISNSRKAFELEKEALVLDEFDEVMTPWPSIRFDLAKRYPQHQYKLSDLSHCWDADDLSHDFTATADYSNTLVYGGTVYKGFEPLLGLLTRLAAKRHWAIKVFTTEDISRVDIRENKFFQVERAVPSAIFFKVLRQSKFALFLIPKDAKDGFPTKVLEYAACGRPIIAVGFEGSLSRLIVDKGLGIFIKIENAESQLEQALESNLRFSPDREWIDSHELSNVTDRLIHLIENTTRREKE
jgi:glycosyltransferase involved in cell wall biosynthesis